MLAECERGLGFGIPHSHLSHLNTMEEVVNYFNWRVEEAEREKAERLAHWKLNLPANVKLDLVPKKARGGRSDKRSDSDDESSR